MDSRNVRLVKRRNLHGRRPNSGVLATVVQALSEYPDSGVEFEYAPDRWPSQLYTTVYLATGRSGRLARLGKNKWYAELVSPFKIGEDRDPFAVPHAEAARLGCAEEP
jgi:hypothetical protein